MLDATPKPDVTSMPDATFNGAAVIDDLRARGLIHDHTDERLASGGNSTQHPLSCTTA